MTPPHLSRDELKALVRTVPDFPHPGIQFRDITTLIGHHQGMAASVHHLAELADAACWARRWRFSWAVASCR